MRTFYLTWDDGSNSDDVSSKTVINLIQETLDHYGFNPVQQKATRYAPNKSDHNWETGDARVRIYTRQFPLEVKIPEGKLDTRDRKFIGDLCDVTGLTQIVDFSDNILDFEERQEVMYFLRERSAKGDHINSATDLAHYFEKNEDLQARIREVSATIYSDDVADLTAPCRFKTVDELN